MPDIDKLVTILRESQLADNVVSARKVGFPRNSQAFPSSWMIDDFMYNTIPSVNWLIEGANQSLPTPQVGGRLQTDDTGDGVRVSVCKTLNSVLPVISPNEIQVRFRQQQVIDILQTFQAIGLFSDLPTGNPTTEPLDGVYFRAVSLGSAANWFVVTRAFNIETSQDTGVVIDLNVDHTYEIEVVNSIATFLIDGLQVASPLTTNIPSANLRMATVAIGKDASPFGIEIDSALIWSARIA